MANDIYPSLVQITRPIVTTREAAFYLNLSAQTLWLWACKETGPIRPIRIGRRLGWLVKDLIKLTGGDKQAISEAGVRYD
jgi:predicted DNA-binding transcriptional regulator AlpA